MLCVKIERVISCHRRQNRQGGRGDLVRKIQPARGHHAQGRAHHRFQAERLQRPHVAHQELVAEE